MMPKIMPSALINPQTLFPKLRWILNRLLILFFFVLLVIHSSREITDLDIWLHLKTGQVITATRHIPLQDIFSFTLQGKEWINHEWLFQLLAHLFYQGGGPDGLIFMQNLVVIALFFLLFFMGVRGENHLLVFAVLYLTLLTIAYRFTIRPDIFSLLFFAVYLFITASFSDRGSRSIWILPVLQCFWTNIHGFSFIGPLVLLFLLATDVIKNKCPMPILWKTHGHLDSSRRKTLVIVTSLTLIAFVINPQGLRGALYPLSVLGQLSGKGKIVFDYIQELARPFSWKSVLDPGVFLPYKVLILVSLFSFRFNSRRLNIWELFLYFFFLIFSLVAIRNLAYFGVAAAFIIFRNIHTALDHGKTLPPIFSDRRFKSWGYAACLAIAVYFPGQEGFRYLSATHYRFDTYDARGILWGVAEGRYQKKAVAFLLRESFPQRMFNDFNTGAYLVGQAYPRRQVFIDGRTEFYGPEFFGQYVKMCQGDKDAIESTIRRYDIQGFFLSNPNKDIHWGLVRYLGRSRYWAPVYLDENAVIFVKKTRENQDLIDRFGIDFSRWSAPSVDVLSIGIRQPYPYPYINRGRLLSRLKFHKSAASEARAALEISPTCGEAYAILMESSFAERKFMEAYRYARLCLLHRGPNIAARSKLALVYREIGEEEKALKTAQDLINDSPRSAEGYYAKALLLRRSDAPEAIRLLRKTVALSARHTEAWEALGDLLILQKDRDGARKAFETAWTFDGSNDTLKRKCGRPV